MAHQTGPINSVASQCSLSSESLSRCLTVAHQTGPINSVVSQCSLSSESLSWCLGLSVLILFPFDIILFDLCLFHCFSESESLSVNEMLFVYVIHPHFIFIFLCRMCFDSSLFAFAGLFVYEKASVCIVIVDVCDLLPPSPSASVILFSFLSFFFSMGLLTVPGNAISCNTNFHH